MTEFIKGFKRSIKTYVKMIPLVIIPVAGIILLLTLAPYLAVSRGCSIIPDASRKLRMRLGVLFGLMLSVIVTVIIYIVLLIIAPGRSFGNFEYSIIGGIFGLFLTFSMLGSLK